MKKITNLVTNGLSYPYHFDESTFIFSDIRSDFSFSFFDEIYINKQNGPNGMTRFAASYMGLFSLPMSQKKDARLLWVNRISIYNLLFLRTYFALFNESTFILVLA